MEEEGVSFTAEEDLDNAEPILTGVGVGVGLVKGLEGVMPTPLISPFPVPSPCPSGCAGGSSTSLIVPSRQRMGGMASKGSTGEPKDNHGEDDDDDDEEEEGLVLSVVFVTPRSASLSFSLFAGITCLSEGVAATAIVAATMGLIGVLEVTLEAPVVRGFEPVAMIGGVMVVVTVLVVVVLAGVAVLTNGCRCCSRLDTAVVAGAVADDEGDGDDGDGRRAGTLSGG